MQLGGIITRYDVHRHNPKADNAPEGLIGYALTKDAAERLVAHRLSQG